MNKKDKELLLKDLCARLPYGVKCNVWYGPKSPALNEKDKYTDDILETINPKKGNCTFHHAIGYDFGLFPVEHVKPYIRSMSSMTEEENKQRKELSILLWYNSNGERGFDGFGEISGEDVLKAVDWLNAHHFDYRGLIPMGLALEAPEGMYN